jgi:hypothetical protein
MSEELMDLPIFDANINRMRSHEFAHFLWILRETRAHPKSAMRRLIITETGNSFSDGIPAKEIRIERRRKRRVTE